MISYVRNYQRVHHSDENGILEGIWTQVDARLLVLMNEVMVLSYKLSKLYMSLVSADCGTTVISPLPCAQ